MAPHPMKERLSVVITWVEGILNSKGEPKTPKDVVWQVLSNLLDEELSPKYIYVIFKNNRWNMCSELMASLGIVIVSEENVSDSEDNEDTEEQNQEHQNLELLPRCVLSVNIPPDKWSIMKPVLKQEHREDRASKSRNKLKLASNVWTHEVAGLIDAQYSFPCALAFKNSRVAINPTLSKNYVSINVYCTECGNMGEGYILTEPLEGDTVVLKLDLVDTRNIEHSKKRQCAGSERLRVGAGVKDQSSSVFRRHEASRLVKKPGDPESPLVYSPEVYRKIKQEERDKVLDLPKSNNALLVLQQMKYDAKYIGSIHDIGLDPIKVYYVTAGQILLHNSLQKQGYYSISLDATSSLVRRMTKFQGLSGHIFLYQFTCSTDTGTAQLNQMLSEQQDANSILHWTTEWIRRGALPPREVVVDDSAALLSALVRAFAGCPDTKTYKEMCFTRLVNPTAPLPRCYLRIDLAHFISNVSRWEVWKKDLTNKMVKDHYLRFIGLMIKEQDFSELRKTLSDLFLMCLSPTCGVTAEGETTACQESTNRLVHKVSGLQSFPDDILENKLDDSNESDENTPANIKAWILDIKENIDIEEHGLTPNPYYSPTVAAHLEKITRSFVLWSAILVPIFKSPFSSASSADVEGDFNDVKHRILKNETKPIKLQKVVAMHLNSIQGQTILLSSHAKKGEEMSSSASDCSKSVAASDCSKSADKKISKKRKASSISSSEDEGAKDLDKFENWRNLAKKDQTPSRRKKGKNYLDPFPQITTAQELMKAPKNVILQNGNLCRHIMYGENTQVKINNTCPFDSLVQVLTLAYLEDPPFRKSMVDKMEKVVALKVVDSLAKNGATTATYHLRTQALVGHCKLIQVMEPRLRKDIKKKSRIEEYTVFARDPDSSLGLEYSAYGNLGSLAKSLFPEFPSSTVYWSCLNGHEGSDVHALLEINTDKLMDKGIEEVHQCLIENSRNTCLEDCNAPVDSSEVFSDHLFINTDLLMPEKTKSKFSKQYKLSEVPHKFSLRGIRYSLAGLVSFKHNHYIGYGRTKLNKWEILDDTCKKVYVAKSEESVLPHLLIYIKRSEFSEL